MKRKYTDYLPGAGISTKMRGVVDSLNYNIEGPFSIESVMETLKMDYNKTKRTLAYLNNKGWINRVKNGFYITVPLGTKNPHMRTEDGWITASKVFAPCYIGGFSAAEHWNLTEQIFSDFVVFTGKKINVREIKIQNTRFLLRIAGEDRMFGLSYEWRGGVKVAVSDASRTLVDILNEPALGGGIRHAALIVREYFESEYRNEELLLSYVKLLGNRAVYKRLGFVVEVLGIKAPGVIDACKKNISAGYSLLDPSIKGTGRYVRRWNLKVNATLEREAGNDIS